MRRIWKWGVSGCCAIAMILFAGHVSTGSADGVWTDCGVPDWSKIDGGGKLQVQGADCEEANRVSAEFIRRIQEFEPGIDGWTCRGGSYESSNSRFYLDCQKGDGEILWIGRWEAIFGKAPDGEKPKPRPSANGLKRKPCFKIWWKEGVCRQRPHYLIMGARANMTKIRWSHWGHRKAIGKGRIYNGPSAGSPNSGIGPARGRIVLSKRVNCFNRGWVFSKYKVTYGPGFKKTFVKTRIFEPCSR